MYANRMNETTLLFLVRDTQVLLGMKKRAFGNGKWNGIGGKLEAGETIKESITREAQEEIHVTPLKLEKMAEITFLYANTDWNQLCHIFVTHEWSGTPNESEEIAPEWFDTSALPFENMWPDDAHWLQPVLEGKKLIANFTFNADKQIESFSMDETTAF
jgi:8-oxo-dGTP pyrophosphatase MutT (NUDIX family)